METVDLNRDLSRDEVQRLLDHGAANDFHFLLVTRKDRDLSEHGAELLDELASVLVDEELRFECPNTQLARRTKGAVVREFRLTSEAAATLLRYSPNLFSWVQPQLPEDLILLRADGSPFLVTTAHERIAYFTVRAHELAMLQAQIGSALARSS